MKGCEACEADKVNGKIHLWKEIPQFEFPEVSAVPAVKANGNVPSWDISQHLRLVPVVRVPEVSAVQREDALVGENENKTRAVAAEGIRGQQFPRLSARSGRNARIQRLSFFQPDQIKPSLL